MGFLQYFLAVPVALVALALFVRACEDPDRTRAGTPPRSTGAVSALVTSIHIVAGSAIAVSRSPLRGAQLEGRRARKPRSRGVHGRQRCCAGARGVARLGEVLGTGVRPASIDFREALRQSQGFEFVNSILQLTWYDPPVTLNYITWASLGPYRWGGLVAPFVAMTWLAISVYRAKSGGESSPRERRYQRAAWGFFAFACFTPWGVRVPAELTYLDFRLIGLAVALLLAATPPRWFAALAQRQALGVACVVSLLTFAVHGLLFAREAQPRHPPDGESRRRRGRGAPPAHVPQHERLFRKGLPRHARAAHVLHTAIYGGICTQFRARYTPHRPSDTSRASARAARRLVPSRLRRGPSTSAMCGGC